MSLSVDELVDLPRPPQRWWLILAGFTLVFGLLQWGWATSRDTALERWVVDGITVKPAAWAIHVVTPSVMARAEGARIAAPGGGINIRNGCEGTEVLFVLIAAFCVARLRWKIRIAGLGGGLLLVFILNQMRILSLFYAYRYDLEFFDLLHTTLAPIIMILLVFLYFYGWLHYDARRASKST